MHSIPHQPALDGIRAIAVLAVMLFHLDSSLLPGGFAGVDVFFVLSGYLITSIIIAQHDHGRFSLRTFYRRRVARIFPASLLVISCVLVVARIIYTAQDYSSTGAVAAAAVASLANMKLMLQGNYFDLSPDAQPLLHFWSLSVEEQFYLLYPVILMWLLRKRAVLLTTMWAAFLASLGLCVMVTGFKPTYAFYLLPTRAWELLAGALVAIHIPIGSGKISMRTAHVCGFLGMCALVLTFATLGEGDDFPGYKALAPVVGTVCVIISVGATTSLPARFLSWTPMLQIGMLSYSLYLWHWPVYCFVDYWAFDQVAPVRTVLKAVVVALCAVASYALCEKPMRIWLSSANRMHWAFGMLAFSVVAVVWIGVHIRSNNYIDCDPADVREGGIVFNGHHSAKVVLMGDSMASMYGTMLRDLSDQDEFCLHVISDAGGDQLIGSGAFPGCLEVLSKLRPDAVVLSSYWIASDGERLDRARMTIESLLDYASTVIVLGAHPTLPKGVSRAGFRREGMTEIFETTAQARLRDHANQRLRAMASSRVLYVDTAAGLVGASGQIAFTSESGAQIYHDRTHLSKNGAEASRDAISQAIEMSIKSR